MIMIVSFEISVVYLFFHQEYVGVRERAQRQV